MLEDVNYYFSYEGQEYFINISEGVPYLFVLHPDDSYDLCDYSAALNYGLCFFS